MIKTVSYRTHSSFRWNDTVETFIILVHTICKPSSHRETLLISRFSSICARAMICHVVNHRSCYFMSPNNLWKLFITLLEQYLRSYKWQENIGIYVKVFLPKVKIVFSSFTWILHTLTRPGVYMVDWFIFNACY